jgi:hypothetical protein
MASERPRAAARRVRAHDGSPAHGWPAPAWLAAGPTPTGKAWIVQEFIDGRPPQQLTDRVAEQMLEILDCRHRCFLALWAVGIGHRAWSARTGTVCVTGSDPGSPGGGGSWQPSTPSPRPAHPNRCPAMTWSMETSTSPTRRSSRPSAQGAGSGPRPGQPSFRASLPESERTRAHCVITLPPPARPSRTPATRVPAARAGPRGSGCRSPRSRPVSRR